MSLAAILRRSRPLIEADFQRHYTLDVAHVGATWFSWRRFRDLLAGLPRESLYVAEQYGGVPWGPAEYLTRNLLAAWTKHTIESPQERRTRVERNQARDVRLHEFARRRREVRDGRS